MRHPPAGGLYSFRPPAGTFNMGDYLQQADVQGRLKAAFARLYDLPADATDLAADIAAAEALCNASVGKRYVVPVTNSAALPLIRSLALDLFEEKAWRRGAGTEIPEKVRGAADVARHQLEQIAKGLLSLAGADVAENPTAGASAQLVAGNAPQFTHTDLEGF